MFRYLTALLLSLLFLLPGAQADSGEITRIEPHVEQGRLLINADIDFDLDGGLHEAALKGVPLYFTVDLSIQRPRWWWLDQTLVSTEQTWRIQFNALTRQWRASIGELSLPTTSLHEALDLVRHIRDWDVAAIQQFDSDVAYEGALRLRLDTSRLARPFQVDALNSNAWSLTTPWKNFTFSLSAATRLE